MVRRVTWRAAQRLPSPTVGRPGRPETRTCAPSRATSPRTRERLEELEAQRPALFFLVSLRDPERDVASYVSRAAERHPREWLAALRRGLLPRDRRLLRAAELERARVRADQAHARLADYLDARPASGAELQWLVRRAFCRGLGEPQVDGLHEPRALVFERNGEAVLGAAGGRRAALDGRLGRAPRARAADRVGARGELAGAARGGRAARAGRTSRARAPS